MATQILSPHVPMPPGSPEWHQQRRLGIGGSEAAALFNEGYGCHKRLILEKRGVPDDFVRPERDEAVLERGTELEDVVADKFVRETGLKVRRQPARVSKEFPHARVNMDRQIIGVDLNQILELTVDRATAQSYFHEYFLGDEPGPGVLECKTINEYSLKKLLKEGLANHPDYIFQIQHSLGVTGYQWGIFAFLEPTWWNFLWFPVKRDEPLIAGIMQQVEKSWGLVEDPSLPLPAVLPAGDKRCRSCLKRKSCLGDKALAEMAGFKEEGEYAELRDPELVQIAVDYRAARAAAEQASEVEEAIAGQLKERIGTQQMVSIPEAGIKINWKPQPGSNRWDGKALEGEVNRLNKMQPPGLQKVVKLAADLVADGLEELGAKVMAAADGDQQSVAKLPVELAERVLNCKKQSAASRPFKVFTL